MASGIYLSVPNRRQLRHWELVCRYLESQPLKAVRHPLPAEPPMSVRLFKRMAQFKLVRHADTDCTWRLTQNWRSIFQRLWLQLPDEETAEPVDCDHDPFIVDAGPDTVYISLLVPLQDEENEQSDALRLLPVQLDLLCQHLKEQAQAADEPVETPWGIFGAPLSMQKAGVGTKGKGKGVSWSYLLRNDFVMIRLRKKPLDRLIGSIRFSARSLWTQGAQESFDAAKLLIAQMWKSKSCFAALTWQLSQLHLCVDVANFAPTAADVERVVSHSRKRAFHIPSTEDEAASFPSSEVFDEEFEPDRYDQPFGWDDLDQEDEDGPDEEEEDAEDEDDASSDVKPVEDEEDLAVDEHRISGHLYGGRLSGFHFSPGAPLSSAWYDKELEERMSGKTWMREIHEACGWKPAMRLFRVEARFGRELLHEIGNTLPEDAPNWCDDPWLAIQHMNDYWGYYAGLPPEADRAPDVTHRGWLRLVIPQGEDSVKSRWPTDPSWLVIQRADFGQIRPQVPLRRQHVPMHDPDAIDAVIYGLMVLRSVLYGRQGDQKLGLDDELVEFMLKMEEWDQKKQRRYAEEVREKARKAGLPVPMQEVPIWKQWESA